MRALTLTQPWLGIVAAGLKMVENRPKSVIKEADFGELFALHASQQVSWPVYETIAMVDPGLRAYPPFPDLEGQFAPILAGWCVTCEKPVELDKDGMIRPHWTNGFTVGPPRNRGRGSRTAPAGAVRCVGHGALPRELAFLKQGSDEHLMRYAPSWAEDDEPYWFRMSRITSHVLAVARVDRVVHDRVASGLRSPLSLTQTEYPWYQPGKFGYVLRDVRALAPIPCSGNQGFWTLPADVADRVQGQLK